MASLNDLKVEVQVARSFIGRISHYVLTHEKLIIIVIGAALVWGAIGKVENWKLKHDQHVYDAKVAQLQQTVEANAKQAALNQQLADNYKQIAAQAQAQNAALEVATAQMLAAVKQQKQVDKTLPPNELAGRIQSLAELPAGSVSPTPDNKFSVTNDGAVGIAQHLEDVPVLTKQVENITAEKANVEKELKASTDQVGGLNQQVGGLKLQLTQADGVCEQKIKVVKDAARKSKGKWFIAGYVAGLATRGAAKIFLGI